METRSRPLARLAAVTTLAAFLVAQSWVVCAPLCLLEGHAKVAMAESRVESHLLHCHSGRVTPGQVPTVTSLGSMLPVTMAQLPSPAPVVSVAFVPPPQVQLQQIPLAEPPPPRSV